MQRELYQNFASQLIRCYWKSAVNKVQGGRDCWLGSEETLSGWSSIWNKPWRRKLLQCNWILSRFVVDSGLTLGSKAEADVLDDLWYSDSPWVGARYLTEGFQRGHRAVPLPQTSPQPFPGLSRKTAWGGQHAGWLSPLLVEHSKVGTASAVKPSEGSVSREEHLCRWKLLLRRNTSLLNHL